MKADEVRKHYLDFFKAAPRSHQIIPPAPLVLPEDPTTLFTSSGMQPLIPYLLGQTHPQGKRLADSQPSFRSQDIDEVGDNRHTTFFEMLGNWSLGDYFKKEQLAWFWQFITQILGLPAKRLYVSVFAGNKQVQRDDTAAQIWQKLGVPKNRIYYYGVDKNWWSRSGPPKNMPPGEIGGPDSEVFFEFSQVKHDSKFGKNCHPNCDCGRFLEIGNSVFIQYQKQKDGSLKELSQQNVDFGGGLERLTAATRDDPDVFNIDLFSPLIQEIESYSNQSYQDPKSKAPMRVISDHLRAASFMIAEGVIPANKTQGYVLRRLLRRSAVKMHQLKAGLTPIPAFIAICHQVIKLYPNNFDPAIVRKKIEKVIDQEMTSFSKTLDKGLKQIAKQTAGKIDAKFAFDLFQTYGFPFEITQELVSQKGQSISQEDFDKEYSKHQQLSRSTATGMFKGGLADHSDQVIKLHTATHLLHQALRQILGSQVKQQGSHITAQRLRFDFSWPRALTPKEKRAVENLVNQKIKENLPVHKTFEPKDKALKSGALAFFKQKYPKTVSVYTIGQDPNKNWFSKELCGGPHVTSTGKIGPVRIKKEKSIGGGIRRIYAALESKFQSASTK